MPTLGNRLRELRKEKALSREDLANAIGISVFAVKSYELGQREPNAFSMFQEPIFAAKPMSVSAVIGKIQRLSPT